MQGWISGSTRRGSLSFSRSIPIPALNLTRASRLLANNWAFPMPASSKTSSVRPFTVEMFRDQPRVSDVAEVERLVRLTGVFNDGEVAIARELIEESLAKGAEASGYHFLFADGSNGVDGYTCFGPIAGTAGRWELYWIAVDPYGHRSGLGKRLQAASEEAVRALGGV